MDAIIKEVLTSVALWKIIAEEIGSSRAEQELMVNAFKNGIDLS